ncbi:hypothetical protein AWB77_06303 [Caballeronia fortuita]|uniref:EamA domain-containing protein n=1 Tax=Caballeronia fortuita TaxID=1777138 RepID=A0A158E2Z9_9BURK|nr:hypothetical protein [Caballeronia fortuita]SAL01232.1 hypothetical protein AWB77_06303 [Caballeronia fortuita]
MEQDNTGGEKAPSPGYTPYLCMTGASVLFAWVEAGVKPISKSFSAGPMLLVRAIFAFVLFTLFIVLCKALRGKSPVELDALRKLTSKVWMRGLVVSGCAAFLTLALAYCETQTFTYALFLVHPLVTLALTKLFTGEHPDYRSQIGPMAITIAAGAGYTVLTSDDNSQTSVFFSIISPLVAGILFSLGNLMAKDISDNDHIDSWALAYQSTLTGLVFSPFVTVVVCVFTARNAGMQWTGDLWSDCHIVLDLGAHVDFADLTAVAILFGTSILAAIANPLVTKAFADASPKQLPIVSILDLSVLVFAAGIGLIFGNISFFDDEHPLFSWSGCMLIAIFAGACLSIYRASKAKGALARTDERIFYRMCCLIAFGVLLVGYSGLAYAG